MTNNDILRRVRYVFDLDDSKVISIFGLADREVTRAEISDWLKKEEDEDFKECNDETLAVFLNGFITDKRGAKDGPKPAPEKELSNNQIMMKLKIALNLKAEEILDFLSLGGFKVSKHELSAFFRKPGHKHYRECKDQALRKFLSGLQTQYRDSKESE